jgi:hypothetical protein
VGGVRQPSPFKPGPVGNPNGEWRAPPHNFRPCPCLDAASRTNSGSGWAGQWARLKY